VRSYEHAAAAALTAAEVKRSSDHGSSNGTGTAEVNAYECRLQPTSLRLAASSFCRHNLDGTEQPRVSPLAHGGHALAVNHALAGLQVLRRLCDASSVVYMAGNCMSTAILGV
jgi:hypothetical protein